MNKGEIMVERVYKLSTLERYGAAGYLDFGNKKYSALDRISAGKRLFTNFYLGGLNSMAAIDFGRIKVDGSGDRSEPFRCLHHRDMYKKAVAAVPREFWPVVRRVCIEDLPIVAKGSANNIKRILYAERLDLCRGLDRLIDFYSKK